jgi:hypothetical protein
VGHDAVGGVHRRDRAKRPFLIGDAADEVVVMLSAQRRHPVQVRHLHVGVDEHLLRRHGHVGPAGLFEQLPARGGVKVLPVLEAAAGRAPVLPLGWRVVVEEEQHPLRRIDRDYPSRQPHRQLSLSHPPIVAYPDGNLARVLERVTVTSYLAPLREGGSLPGLVEADNLGTYVLKFRGAGQGPLALVAEIIAGELDPEIQDLLRASAGLNLAVDFLPGSAGFDPLGWTVDEDFASELLWFDALIQNVDRTWRNPNLLVWHGDVWLIDHGAALYFHHDWSRAAPDKPYDARQHVVRERATRLKQAHEKLSPLVTAPLLERITADVPPEWFGERGASTYVDQLVNRAPVVPEVIRP